MNTNICVYIYRVRKEKEKLTERGDKRESGRGERQKEREDTRNRGDEREKF